MTEPTKHGETPRTDAHLCELYGENTLVYVKRRYEKMSCTAEFARQLERELTEARGENGRLIKTIAVLTDDYAKLERDLEAARGERDGARKGLVAVELLMRESDGVAGLHLNGDVATWDELRTGGPFEEWLIDFDAALSQQAGEE